MTSGAKTKTLWFPPASFYTDDKCRLCGVCCGSTDGHPCEHLVSGEGDTFVCETYARRLGPHRTVDGHMFVCVPIRRLIESTGGYACCGYVQAIMKVREQMGQPVSDLGRMEMPESP